jgi:hypothetical protein
MTPEREKQLADSEKVLQEARGQTQCPSAAIPGSLQKLVRSVFQGHQEKPWYTGAQMDW